MPIPAYSQRFYAGTVSPPNTRTLLGTVPPGKRIVIRDLHGGQTAGSNVYFDLYLNPGGPLLYRVYPLSTGALDAQQLHLVLHEGEQLHGYARTNNAAVAIYGYLLDGAGGSGFPATLPG